MKQQKHVLQTALVQSFHQAQGTADPSPAEHLRVLCSFSQALLPKHAELPKSAALQGGTPEAHRQPQHTRVVSPASGRNEFLREIEESCSYKQVLKLLSKFFSKDVHARLSGEQWEPTPST